VSLSLPQQWGGIWSYVEVVLLLAQIANRVAFPEDETLHIGTLGLAKSRRAEFAHVVL
jgi:hypothetical protein